MLCITGDVHHSIRTPGQASVEGSEASLACSYTSIAENHNIKVTLFVTGRAFKDDAKDIRRLLSFDNLEVGGHTWSAFRPKWVHRLFKLITGSIYGPKIYQSWDIRKTLNIIEKVVEAKPVSWRSHSYSSNETTFRILSDLGIEVVSEEVTTKKRLPEKTGYGRLISAPINVMPDHEHLYYGARTEEKVKRHIESGWSDEFTSQSFSIEDYFKIIKRQIVDIEENSGLATLLLHPLTMHIVDRFQTFEKLCRWLRGQNFETIWCREIPKIWKGIYQ